MGIHQGKSLLVSAGQDNMLNIYDLHNQEHLYFKELEFTPTAIKVIELYNHLAIGYSNGLLQIFELHFSSNQDNIDNPVKDRKRIYISLEKVEVSHEHCENNNYVLSIQLSNEQQKIAVSYMGYVNKSVRQGSAN